ncbi:hypothetical protein F4604DRAFT_1596163 [Suillus subluteus]|nr:hypothetical protein F4604DRAFT_1596163 [Suillus subluteus]
MAYICGSLPNHLGSSLMSNLILSFGDMNILIDKDTNQGMQGNFQAVHFSWYNRHATKGSNTPMHVQPYMLEKEDIQFNYSQLVPYISSETLKNQALYEVVLVVFADLFEWIKEHVSNLPAEYEILIEVARELPCNSGSLVLPFLSLVFNINMATKGHRDSGDLDLCLVLPIGNFKGGFLAMKEPGLVVELLQGDFIIFQSTWVTHFNTHYQGKRASMSTPQRPTRTVRPKPKPKPKAKGKKVREATPSQPEGEEDKEDHDGDSQSDADRGALRSKIEALERQLKTRKKGRSGDALQDERLEGELLKKTIILLSGSLRAAPSSHVAQHLQCQSLEVETTNDLKREISILASLGHRVLRVHVTTVNAFPSSLSKYKESWSCLVDAVEDVKSLKGDLDKIKADTELKEGELVFKAHQKVPGSYGIPGSMAPQQVAETVQWMIKFCAFMYGGLKIATRTFDKMAPFSNPIFKDLFISQWFSVKGEGIHCVDTFKHIPNTTLALIATAVTFCSFCEPDAFLYTFRYHFYLNKLERMQKDCPNWMKQFKKDLYKSIWYMPSFYINISF